MPKRIFVQCPRCQGTLEVNVDTGQVERHWEKKPGAPDSGALFDALIEKAKRRASEGLPDINQTLEAQQRKRDAEFERAKRKAQDTATGPPPQDPAPE